MVVSGRAPVGLRQSLHHLTRFLLVATLLSSAPAETGTPEGNHDAFPPLWHLAPGNLAEYPVRGNKILIDAWSYKERMGIYKIMLSHSAKYFAALGENNEANILWGLPLQHGWQYQSGMYVLNLRRRKGVVTIDIVLCWAVCTFWTTVLLLALS